MLRSFGGGIFLDADVHQLKAPPAPTPASYFHWFSRLNARPNRTRKGHESEAWPCTFSEVSVRFSGYIIGSMDLYNFCFRILKWSGVRNSQRRSSFPSSPRIIASGISITQVNAKTGATPSWRRCWWQCGWRGWHVQWPRRWWWWWWWCRRFWQGFWQWALAATVFGALSAHAACDDRGRRKKILLIKCFLGVCWFGDIVIVDKISRILFTTVAGFWFFHQLYFYRLFHCLFGHGPAGF